MMSLNANRRQKGRPNTSASSSNRNNRSRGGGYEKNIVADGIYANSRFSHLLGSLVGCVVQLQVKNGGIYDGILKTNSPKMDVVLEMAHKREDNGNNNQNAINTTPSKDRLIEKVIFSMTDILSITALDVDLDYAVKDSFTDTAISKCNSNHTDAEMKVLQPWEGGEGDELGGLEKDSSNGWDANDMFRTNEVKFNVQSKYDEALTQYTLPLEKKDTKEFKSREEEATRLANEIEKSDQYKHHIALENGDGDEEEKFSAVKRTSENNATNMQSSSGGSNTGKYIPPNRRTVTGNRNTSRSNFHNHNLPNQRSGNQIPPRLQNQHHHQSHHTNYTHHQPPPNHPPPHQTLDEPRRIPHQMSEEPRRLSHQTSDEPRRLPHQISDEPRRLPHQTSEEPRLNGTAEKEEGERRLDDRKLEEKDKKQEERDKKQEERKIDSDSTCRSSPKQEPVNQTSEKPDLQQTSPGNKGENRRSSSAKGREDIIHELKSFNKNFKLESKVEESVKEATENKQTVVPADVPTAEEQIVTETPITEETVKTDVTDLVKNSNLNPEVKEFIPKFQMNKPPQVPTPPRPQTQSPVNPGIIQQQISQTMPPPYLPSYTVMPPAVVNQPQQQSSPQPFKVKRAVVSLNGPRPDLTAAAAQAATGQPLFNQATLQTQPYPAVQYIPGYQVMPMPAATGHRMVTPTSSMPMVPTSHGAQSNQSHQQSALFMPGHQAQPMPAHLPATHQFPFPAHMPIPSSNIGNQANQQGAQQQPSTHPAPSPVQQHPNSQTRPPTSGTPQPQGAPFQHMAPTNIQAHPPLIPSPQNQCQQTMHTPYPYVSQGPQIIHQGTNGQIYTQQHMPTSGNQTMHAPSSHMGHGHQYVVMPNPQPSHVPSQHPHNQQFQHMAGPNQQHMMQHVPAGFQGSTPNNVVHQFVAGAPPPVQQYQQNH